MAETAKKGKKKKGKTVNLVEFLTDGPKASTGSMGPVFAARSTSSWADESEELSTDVDNRWIEDSFGNANNQKRQIDLSALPTAPVASLTLEVDYSKIPDKPPFTAFLGNLPYDVEKIDIISFFNDIQIRDVRLPQDSGGARPKGFGYAEFVDRESLVEALKMNNETLRGRKLRIDVAGQNQEMGRDSHDRNDRESSVDTSGNWRDMCEEPSSRPSGRFGDNDGQGDRFSRDGDRFERRDGDRGSRDRGSMENGFGRNDGYGDRSSDRGGGGGGGGGGGSYGGGSYGGGSYGGDRRGYNDRGSYGGRDFNRSYRDDRGFGDRGERSFGDRSFGDRGYGDRGDRGYGDRSDRGYGDRGDRSFGDRGDRGYGDSRRFRDQGDSEIRRDFGRDPDREMAPREPEQARERPKLQLKPRSVPIDGSPKPSESRSSIFGGAKPVDTTAKEREIEEKLEKLKVEEKKRDDYTSDQGFRSQRERAHSGDDEFRTRRDSSRSSDSEKGTAHGQRDSEKSVEKEGVGSKESPKEDTKQPEVKEPPPPTVNIWKQRMESQKPSSDDKATASSETEEKSSSDQPLVKSRTENRTVPSDGPTSPTGRGSSAPRQYSRGGERGGSRGRGRGGRGRGDYSNRPTESSGATETKSKEEMKERKERKAPEPKILDEQPPVFHKQSKFSLLMDAGDDDEENVEES